MHPTSWPGTSRVGDLGAVKGACAPLVSGAAGILHLESIAEDVGLAARGYHRLLLVGETGINLFGSIVDGAVLDLVVDGIEEEEPDLAGTVPLEVLLYVCIAFLVADRPAAFEIGKLVDEIGPVDAGKPSGCAHRHRAPHHLAGAGSGFGVEQLVVEIDGGHRAVGGGALLGGLDNRAHRLAGAALGHALDGGEIPRGGGGAEHAHDGDYHQKLEEREGAAAHRLASCSEPMFFPFMAAPSRCQRSTFTESVSGL